LTNHAHVLLCIATNPDSRLRDIAEEVGITERAAHRIVSDMIDEGYLTATRVGRRNRYEVHPELSYRHPLLRDHQIDSLFAILEPNPAEAKGTA
jgi:DNA-binding IclR family transcriptional regulator